MVPYAKGARFIAIVIVIVIMTIIFIVSSSFHCRDNALMIIYHQIWQNFRKQPVKNAQINFFVGHIFWGYDILLYGIILEK